MPTIRKTTPGESYIHKHGTVAGGDTIAVDPDTAEYLTKRGGYERVETDAQGDADTDEGDGSADTDDGTEDGDVAAQIDAGVCPWCPPDDQYEGDHIGQHASSAHPDAWDEYNQE